LGIINSKFSSFYLKERFPASSYNQGTTFTVDMINELPIPKNLTSEFKKRIVTLVKKILKLKSGDIHVKIDELRAQVDAELYSIYGLTKEEIDLVEKRK